MRVSLTDWFSQLTETPAVRRILDLFFSARSRLHLAWLSRLDSVRAQWRTLSRLVRHAARTPFGRDHDFARIRNEGDFRRLVPLRTAPELRRSYPRAGDVWPGPALCMATPTGGGPPVPITAELLAQHRRSLRSALALAVDSRPRAGLLARPVAWLGDGFTLEGDSGLEAAHRLRLPRLLRAAVSSPGHQPAGMLIGPAARIVAALQANPDPVAVLTWRGGDEPIDELRARLLNTMLVELLARPEATLAVRSPHDGRFRLLAEHSVFFEFVPFDRIDDRSPPRLSLAEVRPGEPYELAVSSPAAWACRTGLGVRFDCLAPPLFRLVPLPVAPVWSPPACAPHSDSLSSTFAELAEPVRVE